MDFVATPYARPLYIMLKPVGDSCNLACEYCYYTNKSQGNNMGINTMSDELLRNFIREYIGAQTMREVLFTWHGGEPLLRPLDFYRSAVAWQRQYAGNHLIDNSIQTNGTLLTDEWCRFFKDEGWLVGLSIDGPQDIHDRYRHGKDGNPSFSRVMRGIELLNKHGVQWNAMAVVNNINVVQPLDFYHFFKEIDCHYIQFTPIVERVAGNRLAHPADASDCPMLPHSVAPQQWGNFLCTIFDEWVTADVGSFFIQIFDATLANWVGEPVGICTLSAECGHAAVMECNGDVYACDHFVFPPYKLGNVHDNTIVEMLYGEKQQRFGQAKRTTLPTQCRQCDYLFACHGGCPKNRFARTAGGEQGLNYLCVGYRQFFDHVAPYMDYMRYELLAGRAPANVMQVAAEIRAMNVHRH